MNVNPIVLMELFLILMFHGLELMYPSVIGHHIAQAARNVLIVRVFNLKHLPQDLPNHHL